MGSISSSLHLCCAVRSLSDILASRGAPLIFELSKEVTGSFDFFVGRLNDVSNAGFAYTPLNKHSQNEGCLMSLMAAVALLAPVVLPKWGRAEEVRISNRCLVAWSEVAKGCLVLHSCSVRGPAFG